jgi:hypothetical protein
MYISEIFIENFRIFGSETDSKHLSLTLRPGINIYLPVKMTPVSQL